MARPLILAVGPVNQGACVMGSTLFYSALMLVSGKVADKAKKPTPKRRGVSTTNCRKQNLDGPEEPNV